jgi:hypothetical protein
MTFDCQEINWILLDMGNEEVIIHLDFTEVFFGKILQEILTEKS